MRNMLIESADPDREPRVIFAHNRKRKRNIERPDEAYLRHRRRWAMREKRTGRTAIFFGNVARPQQRNDDGFMREALAAYLSEPIETSPSCS